MFFCLGTEGSNEGSEGSNGLGTEGLGTKVPTLNLEPIQVLNREPKQVPYLEMVGSNGFLFRDLRFQWFPILKWVVPMFFVQELKVPNIPYLEMGGSNVFLFRNRRFQRRFRRFQRFRNRRFRNKGSNSKFRTYLGSKQGT